ncbi:MAG: hypothetical protein KAI25_08360, partial [Hyphomicrobiaceae bacterium]|nr:hypothetical protein [Hyphomicrobiaceae bacterium]
RMPKTTKPPESTGSTRVDEDREKLREAVGFFRTNANLHASSSDDALIGYAHGNGRKKPRADMVRTAWHDYEMACQYAELPVTRYIIARQQRLFDDGEKVDEQKPPPPSDGDAPKSREQSRDGGSVPSGKQGGSRSVGTAEPSSVSDEGDACVHKVPINDGEHLICDDCGEVLGPAPETEQEKPKPAPPPQRKAATRKKAATATDPPDDEEVLF